MEIMVVPRTGVVIVWSICKVIILFAAKVDRHGVTVGRFEPATTQKDISMLAVIYKVFYDGDDNNWSPIRRISRKKTKRNVAKVFKGTTIGKKRFWTASKKADAYSTWNWNENLITS